MLKQVYATIEEDIINFTKRFKKLYIYGAGHYAEMVQKVLQRNGVDINGFLVSNMQDNPKSIRGKEVQEVSQFDSFSKDVGILIAVRKFLFREIFALLEQKGNITILIIEDIESIYQKLTYSSFRIPKLEITAKIGCSVQCKFCPQNLLYNKYFQDDKKRCSEMTLQTFQTCINHMPANTIISFAGFVEPFLHPDAVRMIQYAHEQGHPIEIFTTLVGLTEEKFEMIKDIPFLKVVLHVPDVKQYAKIPTTQEYWKVLERVLNAKKPNGMPFIDSANCQSEPSEEFLEFAQDKVKVHSVLHNRAGNLQGENLMAPLYVYGKIYCTCSLFQNQWVMLPDGTIVLCDMDFGLEYVLGNLLESDYADIIHSEPYLNIRKKMMEQCEDNDILCRNCIHASNDLSVLQI